MTPIFFFPPLGGNRRGLWRSKRNLPVSFFSSSFLAYGTAVCCDKENLDPPFVFLLFEKARDGKNDSFVLLQAAITRRYGQADSSPLLGSIWRNANDYVRTPEFLPFLRKK